MADRFRAFDDLVRAVSERSFDRPPALVCNAHVTGLGVARALAARDVPVIALDRSGDGVAPYSDAVALAGRVTYPLDDAAGFREDVEAVAAALGHAPVAFPCMDEWVHAFAETRPEGVRLPFAAGATDAVLDKVSLYGTAEDLGVPYPETYLLRETLPGGEGGDRLRTATADAAAEELGFPLVAKPARKRAFEEAVGTNVVEVGGADEYAEVVAAARDHDIRLMAQERVPVTSGEDRSYVSYAPEAGDPLGIVGRPQRYPPAYGTSCLVERVETPAVERRARAVLGATDYYGISEAEFVHDRERDAYVLLDVNTRPWKWIGLPVQAGADLPYAAYADAVGADADRGAARDATWVYLPDYLRLAATDGDRLAAEEWTRLASGAFETDPGLTAAVYAPSDPDPIVRLLSTEFGEGEYYCSC